MTCNLVLTNKKRITERALKSRGDCVRRQEGAQHASFTAVSLLWLMHGMLAG